LDPRRGCHSLRADAVLVGEGGDGEGSGGAVAVGEGGGDKGSEGAVPVGVDKNIVLTYILVNLFTKI
jgi:hypothetical protein